MKQQNKIIVVGATSGLGRMLAERYNLILLLHTPPIFISLQR